MSTYDIKKIVLRGGKGIIFRNLDVVDAEKYYYFSDIIANETTHTSRYPGQSLSLETISERFRISRDSQWQIDLGGFDNDNLISHLSFRKPRPQHPFQKHIGEFGISVISDFQSFGIGSAMLVIMETIAREMDVKRIEAKVRTSNHKGINFYRKHHYEIEGMRKQAAFINGLYEDEFYISKILN